MRRFITFLLISIIYSSLFAQQKTNILYIDFSATQRINELIKEIDGLTKNLDGNIIMYISWDNNPIIIKKMNRIKEATEQMYHTPGPSKPDFFNEIDSLNSIMSLENILSFQIQSDEIEKSIGRINFYFFLNLKQTCQYEQDKYFIDQILLTNGLLSKKGKKQNCIVTLYLDSLDKGSNPICLSKLKKKCYEINVY